MVMRNIIGKSGEEKVVDLVKDLQRRIDAANTTPAGDKVLEEGEDFYWARPDGTEHSMRSVDLELEDARVRISEAEEALIQTGERLEDAEEAVAGVREDLDNIDFSGGGGSSSIAKDRPPLLEDGAALPAGAAWLHYDSTGALVGMYRWDGEAWETMPLDRELIPAVDIGTGTFGDLEGERLTVNDTLSARVVQAMSGEVKKLVVTDETILNHATLIGDTVVDNINVQGKLVGKDGVFTGTVDFENVNVTGELLASKISGEYIYGTVLEGGTIRTAGAGGAKVEFSDVAYVSNLDGGGVYPGLSITPSNASNLRLPAAIGPATHGLEIYGGLSTDGKFAVIRCAPHWVGVSSFAADGIAAGTFQASQDGTNMVTYRGNGHPGGAIQTSVQEAFMYTYRNDGSVGGAMHTDTTSSFMRTHSGNGSESGYVEAGPYEAELAYVDSSNSYVSRIKTDTKEAYIYTRAGGAGRYLTVDGKGIWAKTNESGSWQSVSLVPEVRQFQYSALWNADQSPAHIMVQHLPGGKLCQAQIRIQNLSGSKLSLPYDTWVQLNYNPIPSDLRGGFTDYIETTLPQLNARGRVEMNYSTGRIRIKSLEKDSNGNGVTIDWHNNNSIWFPMRWFSPN